MGFRRIYNKTRKCIIVHIFAIFLTANNLFAQIIEPEFDKEAESTPFSHILAGIGAGLAVETGIFFVTGGDADDLFSFQYAGAAVLSALGPIIMGKKVYNDKGKALDAFIGSSGGMGIGIIINAIGYFPDRFNNELGPGSGKHEKLLKDDYEFFFFTVAMISAPIFSSYFYNHPDEESNSNAESKSISFFKSNIIARNEKDFFGSYLIYKTDFIRIEF